MSPEMHEQIVSEAAHALAMEGQTVTEGERENLRRVNRGELSYDELGEMYLAEALKRAKSHAA